MTVTLTGIKASGEVHLGRYLGVIKPALEKRLHQTEGEFYFFIADYHALTSPIRGEDVRENSKKIAAAWLACGLDPKNCTLYRQSDVPEIMELAWVLACQTPKGFMNRAHAYKALVAQNEERGLKDKDDGINMGLFLYPILMSADILALSAHFVPVGEDQIQHIEICRDIAQKFNQAYGPLLTIPQYQIQKNIKTVPGLDGRKMSASYGNIIPLFSEREKLRKLIMKIKTDSSPPDTPKNPEESLIFSLYKEMADPEEIESLRVQYKKGISWGQAKQILFDKIDESFTPIRDKYFEILARPQDLEKVLQQGAEKAREKARTLLVEVRKAVGVSSSL